MDKKNFVYCKNASTIWAQSYLCPVDFYKAWILHKMATSVERKKAWCEAQGSRGLIILAPQDNKQRTHPKDRCGKLRGSHLLKLMRLLSLDSKAGLSDSKDEKNPYPFNDPTKQIQ